MENPSLEIKQEPDYDLNSSDLLEINKQEEYLILDDLETEVKESSSLLGVAEQNKVQTKQPEINYKDIKYRVFYAVLNKIYRCTLCPFGTKNLDDIKYHFNTHNYSMQKVSESPYQINYKELSSMLKDYSYMYCDAHSVPPYRCLLCDFKCNEHEVMTQHVDKYHLEATSYRCQVCNQIFSSAGKVKQHQRIHTKGQLFKCIECEFTSLNPFTKHIHIKKYKEYIYNCNLCIFKTGLIQCWKDHIKSHSLVGEHPYLIIVPKEAQYAYVGSEKHFQCNLCQYNCLNQQTVKTHVKKNHNYSKLHQCQICYKSFVLLDSLKKHSPVHINKCSECDYTSSDSLTKHMEIHTNGDFECDFKCSEPLKKELDNIYYCNSCSYKCELMSSWHDHKILCHSNKIPRLISVLKDAQYMYEHDKKLFKCKLCDANSTAHSVMKKHVDGVHLKIKHHQCEICGKRFMSSTQLIIHVRAHTGERPYKSTMCDYSSCKSITKHMKIHNEIKPHQCNVCEYKSPELHRLKLHMRIHTGEKPFKCFICDYAATHKVSLINHMKKKHTNAVD